MSEVASTASPLADSFQLCSRSFKELYLALFAYGPISLSRFNDEYGRFGVWGGDSGADRTGRGSLDDVLRNDPKMISIIAELLENLNDDLSICISLVGASTDPHKAQSHDGQVWLSDEESSVSSGSDDSFSEAGSRVPSKTQRILHLLAIIVDHVQSLFQVSTLLRRPTISNKYLRSAYRKTAAEMESPFYAWDLAHIIEKRRFWINQQKWDMPAENNEVEDIQHQMIDYLCQRLATANVKRREQLYYWQAHPAQPSTINLPSEAVDLKPVATTSSRIPTQQPLKKAGPRSEVSKPSHETKQSFSTVAKSDFNDSATFSGRPRTEYVSSTKGGKYVLKVPSVPKVGDESPTFKCPYCSISLDGKSMLQRELWKKHVFRDLKPYVCTFEKCENPEKLYLTRHDWIYHETQMHRRQWICASCSQQKFSSRSDMKRHLLETHAGQFPESQITIMVDICERPMDDDGDADCPICLATLSFSALRIHLATHLEELALFVLPYHMENRSQDVGSDKVEGATGQRVASNASGSEDGLPRLDFEKSLSLQDPKIFSTLLQSTVELEHKDIEDWFLTDGQTEQRDNGDGILAIAKGYRDQGRLGEAEELEEHVMEMRKMKLEAIMASQQDVGKTQQQQANQQQKPGQPQPPRFSLTAEQVASLTPDQRKQYIQSMQQFQQSKPLDPLPTPEDMALFLSIRQEEISKFKVLDDLQMDQNTRQAVANKLVFLAAQLSSVSKVATRWFAIMRDENRLRTFFYTQIKVAQQFEDPSLQTLKQSFSMGMKDVDEALIIAQNMIEDTIEDVLVRYPFMKNLRGISQALATTSTPQPLVPQVPPTEANLGNSSERSQTVSRNISVIKAEDTITENFRHINRPKEFEVVVSNEFKERSVFKAVWTSPNNSARGSRKSNSYYSKIYNVRRSGQGYTSIRRFVVWKNHEGHALCLPILTYRNRGTAMPGVEPAHHAIIFTESKSGHPPRSIRYPPLIDRDELPLPNAPICVEPIDPKHQFDVMPRLNYAELYKVEHGIKVYFIGRIHEASVKEFEASYERVQQMVNAMKVQRRVNEMYRGDDGVQKEEDGEDVHPDNRNFMY